MAEKATLTADSGPGLWRVAVPFCMCRMANSPEGRPTLGLSGVLGFVCGPGAASETIRSVGSPGVASQLYEYDRTGHGDLVKLKGE